LQRPGVGAAGINVHRPAVPGTTAIGRRIRRLLRA
jgi:hypothetical protein